MNKKMYLIAGASGEKRPAFRERILSTARSLEGERIKVVLTDIPPPAFSIIPFKDELLASVSVWGTSDSADPSLTSMEGFQGAYSVVEALPVEYERNWTDGETSPGICLFTIFRQKPGISYETFLDRWHNSHTPMSMKYHPLWNYSRNVVEGKLTEETVGWDGIVEEQFCTSSDLLNPLKFFGPLHTLPYRLWAVYQDTNSFLEYKTIGTYYANEIWVRS